MLKAHTDPVVTVKNGHKTIDGEFTVRGERVPLRQRLARVTRALGGEALKSAYTSVRDALRAAPFEPTYSPYEPLFAGGHPTDDGPPLYEWRDPVPPLDELREQAAAGTTPADQAATYAAYARAAHAWGGGLPLQPHHMHPGPAGPTGYYGTMYGRPR